MHFAFTLRTCFLSLSLSPSLEACVRFGSDLVASTLSMRLAAIKIYCETLNKDNVGAAFAVAVAVGVTIVVVVVVVVCRCCPRVVSSVCRLKFSARQASSLFQLFAAHCAAAAAVVVVV